MAKAIQSMRRASATTATLRPRRYTKRRAQGPSGCFFIRSATWATSTHTVLRSLRPSLVICPRLKVSPLAYSLGTNPAYDPIQRLDEKRPARSTEATSVDDAMGPTAGIVCNRFTRSSLRSLWYCSCTESMILSTTSTASLRDRSKQTNHCGRSRHRESELNYLGDIKVGSDCALNYRFLPIEGSTERLQETSYQLSAVSYQPRKGIRKNKAQGELISGQYGQIMICVCLRESAVKFPLSCCYLRYSILYPRLSSLPTQSSVLVTRH